jgi:hypothetical protein
MQKFMKAGTLIGLGWATNAVRECVAQPQQLSMLTIKRGMADAKTFIPNDWLWHKHPRTGNKEPDENKP